VPDQDESQEALRNVDKITDSELCTDAEELVDSEDIKRQFREAKERLASESDRPAL